MDLKEVNEKIKSVFGKQNHESFVEKEIKKVEEKIEKANNEDTTKKETEDAVKMLYDSINEITRKKTPEEKGEIIGLLVRKLSEKENDIVAEQIPVAVVEKILEDSDEINTKHLVEPVGMLPDDKVAEIVQNDDIPLTERKKIAQEAIDSDERRRQELDKIYKEENKRNKIKEQKFLKRLQMLYKQSEMNKSDIQISDSIQEIIKQAETITPNMQHEINKVISRKIAYNYRQYGCTFLTRWKDIFSAKDMLRFDIPSLVEQEYMEFSGEGKLGKDQQIKRVVLKEISKYVDNEYNEEEEIENMLIMLKSYNEDERRKLIETFKSVLQNDKDGRTYRSIINNGLVDVFEGVSEEKIDKMINRIKESVVNFENRKLENQKSEEAKVDDKHQFGEDDDEPSL